MAEIQLKLKSGVTAILKGTEKGVSEMARLLTETDGSVKSKEKANPIQAAKGPGKRNSAVELIIELKEEGFFSKPQGLGDISSTLEEKGYLYPVTTLSGVMLELLKKKMVSRKKINGKWKYGK